MAIKDLRSVKKHLFICNGESCKLLGAAESIIAIRAAIADNGLSEEIHTTKTFCNGRCKDGPIVISQPDGFWFKKMVKDDVDIFVKKFLIDHRIPQDKLLYKYGTDIINEA